MGSFQTVLLVGGGGFLGSGLRYGISGLAQRLDPSAGFPVGTLTVNAIGCFLIGLVGALADSRGLFGPEMRLFFFIGVLGGFTTFSTFRFETFALLRAGETIRASANVLGSVFRCLVGLWPWIHEVRQCCQERDIFSEYSWERRTSETGSRFTSGW